VFLPSFGARASPSPGNALAGACGGGPASPLGRDRSQAHRKVRTESFKHCRGGVVRLRWDMDDCGVVACRTQGTGEQPWPMRLARVGTQIDSARRAKLCMAGWPPSSLKQDDFFHCGRDLAACQRRASPLSRGLNMGAFKRATVFSSPSRCSRDVMLCICYGCRLTLTSLRQDQQLSILINVWHLVKSPFGILLRYSGPGQFFFFF